ncbi:MAG: sodium:calcium symporter [Opitutaceae bacterium]
MLHGKLLLNFEPLEQLQTQITTYAGAWTSAVYVGLFLLSSLLILWRLEKMSQRGIEGTVLGTLFMPYFSGLGNLIFVGVVLTQNGPAEEIAINSWTNNITNLCLLLALPALIWGLQLKPASNSQKVAQESKIHRLSLALTLVAMVFFTLIVWVLGQDGTIDRFDGFALVGLFLFWQCFHIYEVLKENTRSNQGWHPLIIIDLALILLGSLVTLVAVDGIVPVIMESEGAFFGPKQLGLLTGWLMVLPNAVLAFYYAYSKRADVVFSSQVGDGHICIPLCIGLFAIFKPMPIPEFFNTGLLMLAGTATLILLCVTLLGRLPKFVGFCLIAAYAYSLYWQVSIGA